TATCCAPACSSLKSQCPLLPIPNPPKFPLFPYPPLSRPPSSTSVDVSVPVAVGVPGTTVPLSRLPASTTAPVFPPGTTTGESFVPVIVIVTVSVALAPLSSVTVTSEVHASLVPSVTYLACPLLIVKVHLPLLAL